MLREAVAFLYVDRTRLSGCREVGIISWVEALRMATQNVEIDCYQRPLVGAFIFP